MTRALLIGSFLSYCSSAFGESQFIGQVTLHRAVNRSRLHVEPSYHSGHIHQWRLCGVRRGQRLNWIITAGLTTTQHEQCHLKKQNKNKKVFIVFKLFSSNSVQWILNATSKQIKQNKSKKY